MNIPGGPRNETATRRHSNRLLIRERYVTSPTRAYSIRPQYSRGCLENLTWNTDFRGLKHRRKPKRIPYILCKSRSAQVLAKRVVQETGDVPWIGTAIIWFRAFNGKDDKSCFIINVQDFLQKPVLIDFHALDCVISLRASNATTDFPVMRAGFKEVKYISRGGTTISNE